MAGAPERSSTTPFMVVLVALVGLLSTVGAAALGGYWANRSVERQLEEQIQDQRREIYVDYLRAAAEACLTSQSTTDEEATIVDVLNQQGQVLLIASGGNSDLRDAVNSFTAAILSGEACSSPDALNAFRDAFIEAAQPDLE
jgi:hypothetical protein